MGAMLDAESIRTGVSLVAIVVSIIAIFNSSRFSKASLDRARSAAAIAEFNAKLAYRKNILDWGSAVQDALCEGHVALQFCPADDPDVRKKLLAVISKVTSFVDRGRWLLPNSEHDRYGVSKETAYSGLCQDAVDVLVEAYNLFAFQLSSENSPANSKIETLWKIRRQFTSAVQDKIEPRVLEIELQALRQRVEN